MLLASTEARAPNQNYSLNLTSVVQKISTLARLSMDLKTRQMKVLKQWSSV